MTPRTLATGLAAAALFAVGGLAAALPASAAPTAPFTALSLRFPLVGDNTGAVTYDKVDATSGIAATPLEGGGILVEGNVGGAFAHVTITPPTGGSIVAGQTLQIASSADATHATVRLETTGTTCDYTAGSVSVPELVGDASAIAVLAADVVGTCGTIQARVAATTPWTGLSVPVWTDFGAADLMTYVEREVVVKVTGTSAVTFGASTVAVPSNPDDFPEFDVVDDGCKGSTVVPDGTCTVTVGFSPWSAGERTGMLTVPDTTGTGATRVRLDGTGTTDATGSYVGLDAPHRVLDTRIMGSRAPLSAGSTTLLQVTNTVGVPASGVSAVVVNLTAVGTTAPGYFTVFPSGVARPTVSSINFPKGWTGANMVTVPVGADGKVAIYNFGGAAHAVVDVLGFYWADRDQPLGSQFIPLGDAVRLFDSRQEGGALRGGESVDIDGVFGDAAATAHVSEFVVTVTAVGASRTGVLTAWSGEGNRPTASTVNYEPKVIAPNMAIVRAGHRPDGAGFRISNTSGGTVQVVVDLVGVHFADSPYGLRFIPRTAPTRILDTRTGTGLSGAFGAGQTRTMNAAAVSGQDTFALVTNTTGITPTRATFLSVWAAEVGSVRPDSSFLNVSPGLVRAVSAYMPLSGTSRFRLYNSAGSMHVAMDVAGTLDFYPSSAALGPLATTPTSADAGGLPTVRGLGGHVVHPTLTAGSVAPPTITRR